MSPSAYEVCPPAFAFFIGRSGGTGDTAMATNAISTVRRKSNTRASTTATMGMITKTAITERRSRPGRRPR